MNSTVLIVDDEPSARATLEAILEGQGYHLEIAKDGKEALEKAAALLPDVILLDVMMPGMDGIEVCRRLRSTQNLAEVPIILLTALDDRFFLVRGIEAGADDYLTKPVDRQELTARVATITRLNRYRTLLQQREDLFLMAARMVAAQEEERKRISRELHDEFGQALTALTLSLHNLQTDLAEQPDLEQRVAVLVEETNATLDRIRNLAQDLRPPALDTLGFQKAITTFCEDFSWRSNIPVVLQIDPSIDELPDLYAVTLHRVLQESLTNIVKHANATQIWVDLEQEDNQLGLTIQDNGRGFDTANLESDGIGLLGIRERLALAGGKLTLRSRMGHGTVLSAQLPIVSAATAARED
jgi:signal transduction histidine kinase